MKRFFPVFLIVLAFTHVAGFVPLYFYALEEFKAEMSIELGSTASLSKITVSEEEYYDPSVFRKVEEHEFTYRGKMYDFKQVEKDGSNYVFYALADEKETTLVDLLKGACANETPAKSSKIPYKLFKSLDTDFVCEGLNSTADIQLTTIGMSHAHETKLLKGYASIFLSPPDRA